MNLTIQGSSVDKSLHANSLQESKRSNVIDGSQLFQNEKEEKSQAQTNLDLARSKATDILKNAFESDQALRGAKQGLKDKNSELKKENEDSLSMINSLEEEKQEKMSQFTSSEVKDAIAQSYSGMQGELRVDIAQNHKAMAENNDAERKISSAILKSQFMVDGSAEADAILEDANKAFLTDSMQEVQQKMDKDTKETAEAVKEKAEEEAKIEKDEQLEEVHSEKNLQEAINASAQEVLSEVQELFNADYLDEDIKGLLVDAFK